MTRGLRSFRNSLVQTLTAAVVVAGCSSIVRETAGPPAGLAPDVLAFVHGAATPAEAGSGSLAWIHVANELRPEDRAPGRADARIAEIVAAQSKLPIERLALPLDLSGVERIGRTRPASLGILPPAFTDPGGAGAFLPRECVAWKCGTIWIAVPDESPMSELRVWFVLRALTVLRHRYPDAWSALFERTSSHDLGASRIAEDDALAPRRIDAVLVSFDTSPNAIAASITAHDAPAESLDAPGPRRNVAVLVIHPDLAAGGDPQCGSAAIYRSGDPATDFLRYMSDGLVESLVHEMLHVYVEFAETSDPACRFLASSPARERDGLDAWAAAEECVVVNTSLTYFARAGGLSDEVRAYYSGVLDRWLQYAAGNPAAWNQSIAEAMSIGVSGEVPPDGDLLRTLRLRVLDPPAAAGR